MSLSTANRYIKRAQNIEDWVKEYGEDSLNKFKTYAQFKRTADDLDAQKLEKLDDEWFALFKDDGEEDEKDAGGDNEPEPERKPRKKPSKYTKSAKPTEPA